MRKSRNVARDIPPPTPYPDPMSYSDHVTFLNRTTPPHVITLIAMAALSALSMNMFLPSLPGMARDFAAPYWLLQMSIAGYLAVNAVVQIVIGPISDNRGRRIVTLWGLVAFILATIGCVLATNALIFLFFRMCQASVVVALVLSRAVLRDVVPTEQAASALGYVTMGMAVAPMIGPAIGGLIEASFGWRGNFILLALLGLATLALVHRDMGETGPQTRTSLRAQFERYPELLRAPRFWGYALATGFASGTFFAYLGGAPYVASELYHLPPEKVGLYLSTPAIGYFIGNYISGRFSARIGINPMVFWGSLINLAGTGLSLALTMAALGGPMAFFGTMILVGIGNGLVIPNATAGFLSVRPHLAGTASGLGGAIMISLGAILSAIGGLGVSSTSATPLLVLMNLSAILGWVMILLVIKRARRIAP